MRTRQFCTMVFVFSSGVMGCDRPAPASPPANSVATGAAQSPTPPEPLAAEPVVEDPAPRDARPSSTPDALAPRDAQVEGTKPVSPAHKGVKLEARKPAMGSHCLNFRRLRRRDGSETDCYPYRCRNARCPSSCKTMADCAGSQRPDDLSEGWPLECISAECVPMPPHKVNGP